MESFEGRHFGAFDLLWGPTYFSLSLSFCKIGIIEWILEDCVRIRNDKGRTPAPFPLVNSGSKEDTVDVGLVSDSSGSTSRC